MTKYIHSIPGPGAHSPDTNRAKKSAPQFSMGGRVKDKSHNYSPGPGNYENRGEVFKKAGPKFGFGTSQRSNPVSKSPTPGPGAHRIPSRIGDVPNFALTGKKNEFKYI